MRFFVPGFDCDGGASRGGDDHVFFPFYAGVFHLGLLVPKGNEFILALDRALVACSISCNSLPTGRERSAIGGRSGTFVPLLHKTIT